VTTLRHGGEIPSLAAGFASERLFVPYTLKAFLHRLFAGSMHNFSVRVSDWFLGGMLLAYGSVILFFPATFAESRVISVLVRIAPVYMIGYVCFAIGGMRALALTVNGSFPSFRWSPHVRLLMCLLSCFVWFQFVLGAMFSGPSSMAIVIYPFLFLFDIYNTFLTASEAGIAERVHRNGPA